MTVRDDLVQLLNELPDEDLPATLQALRSRASIPAGSSSSFFQVATLAELAAQQQVRPIDDPDRLRGDFWPENESIDDLLATLRSWRRDGE
jgi:hypothetical protein